MKIKKNQLNFAVGPVMIDDDIAAIGAEPIPYFRTTDFSALMLENERILKELFDAPQDARGVFLTGSGTASMDAAICNVFNRDDKLLIVNGGGFGQRFCDIAKTYGIDYDAIVLKPGSSLKEVDLAQYIDGYYTGLVVNMNETSTGVLYDMELISQFCRNKDLVLVVDAISSFVADPISMKEWDADVILTGSQKALAIPPGVSMLVLSQRAIMRINKNKPSCYYLNLQYALKNQERGQTPWTPAVGIMLQLNARLNQIATEGIDAERARIAAIAEDFRKRIEKYPFKIVSESLSNTVTPISPIDPEVSAFRIFEILKDEYNIVVCPNGGDFADKIFRVGHIGNISVYDNDVLFSAFDDLIARGILKAQ